MPFRPGDQVNHYTLRKPLGEGGQGSVWEVIDPRGGGVIRALKLVSLNDPGSASFERAVREARILATTDHHALVRCHSFFEEPRDGIVGLLMDFVPGRSLADALQTRGLNQSQSVALLAQVAEALAYLHGRSLVHRDLKPGNIMLSDGFWEDPKRHGAVKLVDFGIAASGVKPTQLTRTGAIIGTLPYLPPELVDPATWGRSEGPQRDIFAFGVMAYQLLMHKHPTGLSFDAGMIDFARAYKAAEGGVIPWPPSGIEASWGLTIDACLALRASDRPANGAAVLELLRTGVASKREPRRDASRSTEPYSSSPSISPPEPAQGAPSARTEPMPAPPAVRTAEATSQRGAAPSARPRSYRKLWAALVMLAFLLGGSLMFVLLRGVPTLEMVASPWTSTPSSSALASSPSATPSPSALAYSPSPLPSSSTPKPSPSLPSLPFSPPKLSGLNPCSSDKLPFDPAYTRFACPVCDRDAQPLPSRSWYMRFSLPTSTVPLSKKAIKRKVCAEITTGASVCVPFSALPDPTGAEGRLRVTTADIDDGHIYFSIRTGAIGDKIEAKGYARRKKGTTKFLETALCSGFVLYIDNSTFKVSVFLDET